MLLPAIQQVRASARNTQCLNRLRMIGVATHLFEDSYTAFPPARLYPKKKAAAPLNEGGSQPSWLVRILPYLEQEKFYQQWDLSMPYTSQPEEAMKHALSAFLCPERHTVDNAIIADSKEEVVVRAPCGCGVYVEIDVIGGATGDYAGNHGDLSPGSTGSDTDYYYGGNGTGVIISSQAKRNADGSLKWIDRIEHTKISDGASNTLLAGELHVTSENLNTTPYNGAIYNGDDLASFTRIGGPGVPMLSGNTETDNPILGFGSWHTGTCNFVFADGSTRSINTDIDTVTLGQICNRSDGGVPQID